MSDDPEYRRSLLHNAPRPAPRVPQPGELLCEFYSEKRRKFFASSSATGANTVSKRNCLIRWKCSTDICSRRVSWRSPGRRNNGKRSRKAAREMDLTDIWPGFHNHHPAGPLDTGLQEIVDGGGWPCAVCSKSVIPDDDFDLYTTYNCQVVCLTCAESHVPDLVAWAREFRRLREHRKGLERFRNLETSSGSSQ